MPLLTVVNLSDSELILSDIKKSFPSFSVPALSTVADVKMLSGQLEAAGPLLKRLLDASAITYSVAEDPDVPDDLEGGQVAGGGALADGAVTTAKLAAAAVTKAKAAVFASGQVAATGSAQNVAHGLGVAPALVMIVPVGGHDNGGGAGDYFPVITPGSHTTTNVVVTVTAGAKFQVLAWA
jgi:hypothetical protein